MTTWRYCSVDIVTGQVKAANLPLTKVGITEGIGTTGELSASLPLDGATPDMIGGVWPRRNLIFALLNETPIWAGIIWNWAHTTMKGNSLPLKATTLESLLNKRTIDETLTYTTEDPFNIVRDLISYALSKSAEAAIPSLAVSSNLLGTTTSVSYAKADHTPVWDAIKALADANGFEYALLPQWNGGSLGVLLYLGTPSIGTTLPSASLTYPGNVTDASWPIMGEGCNNSVLALGDTPTNGVQLTSVAPYGVDQQDLDQGYPLMQTTVSCSNRGLTTQAMIDAFADAEVAMQVTATNSPEVIVPVNGPNQLSLVNLRSGNYVNLSLLSPLTPTGQGVLGRITNVSTTISNEGKDEAKLTIGIV